ncbi:M23 family metallopeptidase [Microbacterium oryzae]|uniref:murein hydrolase activator EnvC family protein n=1 Tax=Microbacterium oryzae TaxID=743009 RepID=UPI0025B045C7|nr:M23 family metallopeptidase [Microbacterium oryzae]MDN3310525.1 M23 family metallopeptidase [Microbacterium oryzae]
MRRILLVLVVLALVGVSVGAAPASAAAPVVASASAMATAPADAAIVRIRTSEPWRWPVSQDVRVVRPFAAPPHRYGAGHRGVDLAADQGPVLAPASGVIAFAGVVVDRPLLTIDHGDGLVTTLEPVATDLRVGDAVAVGQELGELASGGHAAAGAVHFGVRLHGEYVNPLLLLAGVPRAVLLPCC